MSLAPSWYAVRREQTRIAVGQARARLRCGITDQEAAVLQRVADGATNDKISAELGVGKYVIADRMRSVMLKLSAANRAHAVAKAFRAGVIE